MAAFTVPTVVVVYAAIAAYVVLWWAARRSLADSAADLLWRTRDTVWDDGWAGRRSREQIHADRAALGEVLAHH